MATITSVSSAATALADYQAITVVAGSAAANLATVGMGLARECRAVQGLSPTDQAAMENIAQGFERYVHASVEPSVRA